MQKYNLKVKLAAGTLISGAQNIFADTSAAVHI